MDKTAAGQELIFSTPAGRTIEVSHFPQFPDVSAETSRSVLAVIAPKVNATTAVTRWQGEDCDYGMAVEALLARDTPHVSAETSPGMQAAGSVSFGEIRRARSL